MMQRLPRLDQSQPPRLDSQARVECVWYCTKMGVVVVFAAVVDAAAAAVVVVAVMVEQMHRVVRL
jgi:hypothetical protein